VDLFATKLNPAGNGLVYSTYLGGSAQDFSGGIEVDASGNAYLAGDTNSPDFPLLNPFQAAYAGFYDAFVAKLNAAGSALLYSTFLGGEGEEFGNDVAVDAEGSAYVTGETSSVLFPTTPGAFDSTCGTDGACNLFDFGLFVPDGYVSKLDPSGFALLYSTYLGGSLGELTRAIAVDSSGNAYIVGGTPSSDYPLAGEPLQADSHGFLDVSLSRLNRSGTGLLYSTLLGGEGTETAYGIAIDAAGSVYLAGFTGSSDFPVTSAYQEQYRGSGEGFIAKISDVFPGPPTLPANSVVNGASFRPATEPGGAIAPGAIVSLFGTNLASGIRFAESTPLPETLEDTSVTFNGIDTPLFVVSGGQINAQVPFELMPGEAAVQVRRGSETSAVQPVAVAAVSPGIFTVNQQGTGQGAVLISNTAVFAAPSDSIPGRESRPVQRGEFISIFCTGLGDVTNRPPSGEPPSGDGLSVTLATPNVTIGGRDVTPSFSGLTGFVGLYQVDVQVPVETPTGDAVELVIAVSGVASNTVTIAVQ
jgi:uncharacterized protein (TIGR03437 family)